MENYKHLKNHAFKVMGNYSFPNEVKEDLFHDSLISYLRHEGFTLTYFGRVVNSICLNYISSSYYKRFTKSQLYEDTVISATDFEAKEINIDFKKYLPRLNSTPRKVLKWVLKGRELKDFKGNYATTKQHYQLGKKQIKQYMEDYA